MVRGILSNILVRLKGSNKSGLNSKDPTVIIKTMYAVVSEIVGPSTAFPGYKAKPLFCKLYSKCQPLLEVNSPAVLGGGFEIHDPEGKHVLTVYATKGVHWFSGKPVIHFLKVKGNKRNEVLAKAVAKALQDRGGYLFLPTKKGFSKLNTIECCLEPQRYEK